MIEEEFGGKAAPTVDISNEALEALAAEQREPSPPLTDFGLEGWTLTNQWLVSLMIQKEALHEIPSWQPPWRLPSLRNSEAWEEIKTICKTYLNCPVEESIACTTGTSSDQSIKDIYTFLQEQAEPFWLEQDAIKFEFLSETQCYIVDKLRIITFTISLSNGKGEKSVLSTFLAPCSQQESIFDQS